MEKLTLSEVMQCLKDEFSTDKWSRQSVKDILESYDITHGDWRKYCKFDDHKYYRVVIDQGNDRYNLVILCWNCGQGTPVHDHPTAECMFKVCEGSVCETRYSFPQCGVKCNLEVSEECCLTEGQVGHINDSQGIHRMCNDSDTDTCVTLHCYFPPYKTVNTYDERTGDKTEYEVKRVTAE
ncbi:hypothetical protein ACHWQZ_G000827 [Mnemiopsis leidyi]